MFTVLWYHRHLIAGSLERKNQGYRKSSLANYKNRCFLMLIYILNILVKVVPKIYGIPGGIFFLNSVMKYFTKYRRKNDLFLQWNCLFLRTA